MILVVTVMGLSSGESQCVSPFVIWYSGSCEPCPLCSFLSTPAEVPWEQLLCANSEQVVPPPVCKRIVDQAVQLKFCGRVPSFLLSQFLKVVPEAESSDPTEYELVL